MKITEKWIERDGCGKNPGKTLPALLRSPLRTLIGPALLPAALLLACEQAPPPGAEATPTPSAPARPQAGSPTLPKELQARPNPKATAASPTPAPLGSEGAPSAVPEAPPADYKGPWLAITSSAAGVYGEASFEAKKLGYIRNGGRVPVEASPVSKKNCTGGWYKLIGGGFVCGNLGTTDLNHPDVKFATQGPNLDEVLPYPYARNGKNGTPLYKSVPSREQMERYEPYLKAKEEDASADSSSKKARKDTDAADAGAPAALPARLDAALADAGVALPTAPVAADPEPEKPWWQRDDMKDKMHQFKLDQLSEDADDILAKRMVAGFYVAVDKTFRWNNRSWYKTTRGLVTPSDRFWQTAGSKFKGVELGTDWKLPMGFVFGGNKTISSYTLDDSGGLKPAKSYEHFAPIQLTGKEQEIRGNKYAETGDGSWVKRSQIRVTSPGPMPADLKPTERWIDVNLSTQTLVAYEGEKPIYATLVSSGRESKIKDKDHRTPTGEWRVREKHITTTMDGDGTAAGDLPYSIEDVPYVLYYFRSYALHGAFWHANYGSQMSHGCVNLAPLDAKYLFFFADPPLPKGWHGVHASDANPGSRVIVHN